MRGSNLSKFSLVLLIHSHQPVGNFDAVIEQTYQRAYLPFVERLLKHRGVRLGLHYTGPLLEWFERRHPEFFDHLRELTSRGQVELVGGGFYEPILVSIPPADQLRQIQLMREYLLEKFSREPDGAWLAERVWEPQAPYALASAGVKYTLVDDVHFQAAGFELDQLHGDYVCEDRGQTVRVFPGLKILRYLLPFRPREEAIAFLRESAQRYPGGMAAMGDDCEKFGAWPGTYDLNYRDGWLDGFFDALEEFGRLAGHHSAGRVYPRTSAPGPRRPAHGILLGDDGVDPAHQGAERLSPGQPGICQPPGRAALLARRAVAGLLHQICRIESVAQEDAARFGQATQL